MTYLNLSLQSRPLADALPGSLKRLSVALIVSTLYLSSTPLYAMSLGAADVRSSLGQSLQVAIPLMLDGAEGDLGADCFRLERGNDADLPQLNDARLKLARSGGVAVLQITTQRPVNDPVLSFSVATQCNASIRRNYTILLDTPAAIPARQAVAAVSTPETNTVTDNTVTSTLPMQAATPSPRQPDTRRTQQRVHKSPALPVPRQPRVRPNARATLVIESAAPPIKAASTQPGGMVLRISPSLRFLPGQHPLSPALLASLKRQQAELQNNSTDQLDDDITALKMQLAQARQSLTALQGAASKPATVNPISAPAQPSTQLSTYLLPVAGLILLAGLGLYWLRRNTMRRRVDGIVDFRDTTWSELPSSVAQVATPAANETIAPTLTDNALNDDSSAHVQPVRENQQPIVVSSLSRVTEEASVFCRLGYPQRAVELLQEHIASTPVSHPQAWYVLFDIYREHNLRDAFNSSLADFKRRFNLVTPSWENTNDIDGPDLQSFAHVIERITQLWPTAACQPYIKGLLYDDRGGERQGFSINTYTDLLFLIELLDYELEEDTPDAVPAGSHLRLV
jgi:hypothetical protein